MAELRKFPDGFLWGTATAAHQVEGGNHNNDWWRFEQQGGIATGESSDPACDQYRRFREDFRLLRSLHQNSHRLSIEWSRVEPEPGKFDALALRHYGDVLAALREEGLRVMLTLQHFTSPVWFADRGGWAASGAEAAWLPFVGRVVDELGELVDLWCTINEPNIYSTQGWIFGAWPPAHRNDIAGHWRVLGSLHRAHEAAYRLIKRRFPDAPVGLAHNRFFLLPAAAWNPLDQVTAQVGRLMMDHWPGGRGRLEPTVAATADYIGLNHYGGRLIAAGRQRNPPGYPISDFGDAVKPDWMRRALADLGRHGKPVYVTESGIATTDDGWRQEFLREILGETWKAIAMDAVDVRGYFHWTAIDNFEWARGYAPKFGLIGLDLQTQERTPKPSAHLFGRIAAANALLE